MDNITDDQLRLVEQFIDAHQVSNITWDELRGVASSIRGNLGELDTAEDVFVENARAYLLENGLLFGIADPDRTLDLLSVRDDDLGWRHCVFQQKFLFEDPSDGLPDQAEIYGAKVALHITGGGIVRDAQSSCWRDVEVVSQNIYPAGDLVARARQRIDTLWGFDQLNQQMQENDEQRFPIMSDPALVVYPWRGAFRLTWLAFAYSDLDVVDNMDDSSPSPRIAFGLAFFDAVSGERFLLSPTSFDVAANGDGLSVTPLGGGFANRTLHIDDPGDGMFYLRNLTHDREIITYDLRRTQPNPPDAGETANDLATNAVSVSQDTNQSWDRLPANSTMNERVDSQQPEVDLHFFANDLYEWYEAVAGIPREGWDDGQFPPQTIHCIAHAAAQETPPATSGIYGAMHLRYVGNAPIAWIEFGDGDANRFDYLSGSRFLVGHEYQHGITEFSFSNGGSPGLPGAPTSWRGAVHEGLSNLFGALYADDFTPATEISPLGRMMYNLVYPRDARTPAQLGPYSKEHHDHFDDRLLAPTTDKRAYVLGAVLAHCGYLMGQGGIHERMSRTPEFIPVQGLGFENYSGNSVPKTARIWYRALTVYLSNIGSATGLPVNDETIFRDLRDYCVNAAEDIYGTDSVEHRTTIMAFYAVGLQTPATNYGADVTFIPWGWSWRRSQPFLGISSPNWSSLDLFINNGGMSEWNAVINVIGADGNPTTFENNVYCRVRNVGDLAAHDVQVTFEYAAVGSGLTNWQPMLDASGAQQTLNVGTLGPGQSNFPDSDQDSPPASAGVRWAVPPIPAGTPVNHYCIRATVTADDDVNPFNNQVQSNVAYIPYMAGIGFAISLIAANPFDCEIPLELEICSSLPDGWELAFENLEEGRLLEPGEEVEYSVTITPADDDRISPPFDGTISGNVSGHISAAARGVLTEARFGEGILTGAVAMVIDRDLASLFGHLRARLNTRTGRFTGKVAGVMGHEQLTVGIDGHLRPYRRVEIAQLVDGEAIGGVTIQVQAPIPDNPLASELPPASTFVRSRRRRPEAAARLTNSVRRLVDRIPFGRRDDG